jgi:signal transduction histidine kinase
MTRTFLRLYGAVVVSVLVGVALVVSLVRWGLPPGESLAPKLTTDIVLKTFTELPETEAIRLIEQTFASPVQVLDEPPPPRPGPPRLVIPLQDGRRVVVVHPRPPFGPGLGPVVGAVTLLATALVLGGWIRRLQSELAALEDVAVRLGRRELDARAPIVPDSATEALARATNDMAERITALLRDQQDLMVGVSHELRTPLHRMRFALELLADEADPGKRSRRVAGIEADIAEIDALVTEISDWARLGPEGAQPAFNAVELRGLLGDVAGELRRLAPDREIVVEGGGATRGDVRLLTRLVRNLGNNAVLHGAGRVTLRGAVDTGGASIVVTDEGRGVPAADRDRALAPFVRLDPSRHRAGLGLGLALVDRIARAHGGAVDVDGARFTVRWADRG